MTRNFTTTEVYGLDHKLVRMLDDARDLAKTPFVITSGFRKGDTKAHGLRKAVDLRCRLHSSKKRQKMIDALREVGFCRMGIYDKHIHVDIATGSKFPQDVTWWGKSN